MEIKGVENMTYQQLYADIEKGGEVCNIYIYYINSSYDL